MGGTVAGDRRKSMSISTQLVHLSITGRLMGRVIAYVTQYVPYHPLCKSQYMLTPLSRAWSVPITFNHNDMSVSTVRAVHRLCVFRWLTVSDPTRK